MAKEVLVVGAGFGGLEAARALARDPGVRVTVVDQRNHHLFQPLLYQVATAGLNPADIAVPIRAQFSRAPNAEVRLGRVASVDLGRKRISLEDGTELGWDFLVLAGVALLGDVLGVREMREDPGDLDGIPRLRHPG